MVEASRGTESRGRLSERLSVARALLTLKKDALRQLSNRSERRLTCRHLQKTSHRQADGQLLPISEEQISDLDSTNPVKQTVSEGCL